MSLAAVVSDWTLFSHHVGKSYQLPFLDPVDVGFLKAPASVEGLRLSENKSKKKKKKDQLQLQDVLWPFTYTSVSRRKIIWTIVQVEIDFAVTQGNALSGQDKRIFTKRDAQGAESAVRNESVEGEFTLVISHFVRGLSLTGQRRAGRERQ